MKPQPQIGWDNHRDYLCWLLLGFGKRIKACGDIQTIEVALVSVCLRETQCCSTRKLLPAKKKRICKECDLCEENDWLWRNAQRPGERNHGYSYREAECTNQSCCDKEEERIVRASKIALRATANATDLVYNCLTPDFLNPRNSPPAVQVPAGPPPFGFKISKSVIVSLRVDEIPANSKAAWTFGQVCRSPQQ